MAKIKTAVFPGSFDPVTNGHLDVINRALNIFDSLVVAVAVNDEKNPMFTLDERREMLKLSCSGIENIEFDIFEGLLVDEVRKHNAVAVVRGLRAVSDFETEFQMAMMNRELNPGFETLFLMPSPENSFVSSKLIKEITRFGGDVSAFVPVPVTGALRKKQKNL